MVTSVQQAKKQTGKKRGKATAKKRELVDEIIKAEPKKRGRKPKEKIDEDIKPINRGVKKPNLAQRAALARHLGISTMTLYNREGELSRLIPEYSRGLSLLPKNGGSLKELPDLTPYQQFCHMELESLKRPLGSKDCTPNEMIIRNNLEAFDIDLFNRQQQLTVDVEVESSEIEQVLKTSTDQ